MSKIQVNEIVNHFDTGAPDCPKGLTVTGFTTFTGGSSFSGDVSIGGTLTYEDVTNIDSVGIITAQSGVHYGTVGSGVTIDAVGAGTSLGFLVNGSERVRIDNSGRFGIGTIPSQLLHLSSAGFPTIRVTDADNSTYFDITNSDGDIILKADEGNTFANSAIRFMVDSSEKFRCDSSGRLLIGTSTSQESLSILQAVAASNSSVSIFSSDVNASGQAKLNFGPSNNIAGAQIVCTAEEDFSVSANRTARLSFSTRLNGSLEERMRIASGGGIFAYNLTGSASAGAILKLISNEIVRDTSSIQFKKDVEDIEESYAANLLDNARPVWFRGKDDKQNPEHSYWGFIAEELAEVEPRLCVFEDGAPFSVDYGKFSPLLLKLIQMQNEKIKVLETRLTSLEGGAS